MGTKGSSRIYGLDAYRAIAITLVILGHGAMVAGDAFAWSPKTSALLEGPFSVTRDFFSWFFSFLRVDGVELFFVLSGFLIGTILIKILEREKHFNFATIGDFWKRRWFRTLPNYYLILLANYVLVSNHIIGGDIKQFDWTFFVFSQNLYEGFYGFFWESWSLSIEEWFYLMLPLVIYGLHFFLSRKDTVLVSIALLIGLPLAYRISQANEMVDHYWFDVEFRKVVIMRLDTIIYGVFAAWVRYYYADFWRKSKYWMLILGLTILYFAVNVPKSPNDFYTKTFFFSVVSIGAMLLLPFAESVREFRVPWFGKLVTHISKISYSMYLVNLALVAQVILKNFPPETKSEQWIMYLVFWSVTIGLSTLLYYFFERPVMNLRDRF